MRIGLIDVDGHNFPNLPLILRRIIPIMSMQKRCIKVAAVTASGLKMAGRSMTQQKIPYYRRRLKRYIRIMKFIITEFRKSETPPMVF